MNAVDRSQLAAELHAYADAIAAGTADVPALQIVMDGEHRLRVIPRVLHDAICRWRVATAQETEPVVLGCAGCGLCYPRETSSTEGGEPR